MSTINLRAWDKSYEKMLYRDLFDINWYLTEFNDENSCNTFKVVTAKDRYRLEVMLSVDFLDINHKRAYEGDIILPFIYFETGEKIIDEKLICHQSNLVQIVKNFGMFGFYNKNKWIPLYKTANVDYFFEIKGNIYENPELLNE
jgi:hypothetical protein